LGKVIGYLDTIKFQKRGLPHAHILLILDPADKLLTLEHYDSVICAEIPDKNLDPQLYETISRCMVHGPCGTLNKESPCMKYGESDASIDTTDAFATCSKKFPKL
jgi:hypothetical protein